MKREDFKYVTTGRTRVRHHPSGDVGTIIAPLPAIDREHPGNPVVQFDGEDAPSSVSRHDLEVVEW